MLRFFFFSLAGAPWAGPSWSSWPAGGAFATHASCSQPVLSTWLQISFSLCLATHVEASVGFLRDTIGVGGSCRAPALPRDPFPPTTAARATRPARPCTRSSAVTKAGWPVCEQASRVPTPPRSLGPRARRQCRRRARVRRSTASRGRRESAARRSSAVNSCRIVRGALAGGRWRFLSLTPPFPPASCLRPVATLSSRFSCLTAHFFCDDAWGSAVMALGSRRRATGGAPLVALRGASRRLRAGRVGGAGVRAGAGAPATHPSPAAAHTAAGAASNSRAPPPDDRVGPP